MLPTLGFELMPQTDEGEVHDRRRAAGRHAHRAHARTAIERHRGLRAGDGPRGAHHHLAAGGGMGGFGQSGSHRGKRHAQAGAARRAHALERSDRAAAAHAERQAAGRHDPRASAGGNFQLNRLLGGGGDGRLSLEDPRPRPRRRAPAGAGRQAPSWTRRRASPTRASAAKKDAPSSPSASIARRRRCSASASPASPTRCGPTSGARRRRSSASAATNTRSSCGSASRTASASSDVDDVLFSTPGARWSRRRT